LKTLSYRHDYSSLFFKWSVTKARESLCIPGH
jgi:hypothetical protein